MVNKEYAIAYREVLEILKYIPKEDFDKIPSKKIELYKACEDKNFEFTYNPNKTLNEQNVSKRAKAIIGLLFRDYWATPAQKEKIINYQNCERNRLEEEKKLKYNYSDIFKNQHLEIEKEKNNFDEEKKISSNLIAVEIKKENIFKKILDHIKRLIFKR